MICKECKGEGEYEIKNAYDPEFNMLVDCEYCDGLGFEKGTLRYPTQPKKPQPPA